MKLLMVSLDKKILDPNSAVAQRMIEYGKTDELFIIIPDKEKKSFDLSQTVHVWSTGGGNKIAQFIKLFKVGKSTIQQFNPSSRGLRPHYGASNLTIEQFAITTQDPFFTGLVGWLLKRKYKIKLEVQMHGDFLGDYYRRQWLRVGLAKFVLKRADVIRVVGERIKQNLTKLTPAPFWCGVNKIDASKIIVRPIAVDTEKIKNYQSKTDLHQLFPEADRIFICLGRLDPVKNIPWLVELFGEVVKQRKKCLLLVVGDGVDKTNIQYQISNIKLQDNVKFESWTDDPVSYLKTADCLLFPSLSEGYGLVPMEASAAGTQIIMNDVGVANYELKPSERVEIIPVSDREAWIKAILEI